MDIKKMKNIKKIITILIISLIATTCMSCTKEDNTKEKNKQEEVKAISMPALKLAQRVFDRTGLQGKMYLVNEQILQRKDHYSYRAEFMFKNNDTVVADAYCYSERLNNSNLICNVYNDDYNIIMAFTLGSYKQPERNSIYYRNGKEMYNDTDIEVSSKNK